MQTQRDGGSLFSLQWLSIGIAVGLGLQLLGWFLGVGLLGGLPSYLIMGVIVGVASPGDTIVEPGVAAFGMATLGFLVDHLLLTVLGVGLIAGVGYGLLGLALGLAGGWIGEAL